MGPRLCLRGLGNTFFSEIFFDSGSPNLICVPPAEFFPFKMMLTCFVFGGGGVGIVHRKEKIFNSMYY